MARHARESRRRLPAQRIRARRGGQRSPSPSRRDDHDAPLLPGTATGLLLDLPLGVALILEAKRASLIAWPTFAWAGPLTALSLLVAIPPLFAIGRLIPSPSNGFER